MDPFSQLLSALGLSSAAGLNAYIPLLLVGILDRLGYVSLAEPYALLAGTPALAVLSVLALVDFVADKVPAVDHAAHIVGALVHPVAGAIVFASQNSLLSDIHPGVALAAGFVVAGGFHATRAAVRPVATATTAGLGNPVLSFIEDVVSLLLSLLALLAPLVALALLLVLCFALVRAWRVLRRAAVRR